MSDRTIPIWRFRNGGQLASLYYYNGNFFYPLFLAGVTLGTQLQFHIAKWRRYPANEATLQADRAHPEYRNKVQLAEAQGL